METKRKCQICGQDIEDFFTIFRNKKDYKTSWFYNIPFIYKEKYYYRVKCVKCFLKKYNRLPLSPNIINKDYIELLNLPEILYNEIKQARVITLENFVKKYGNEEGKIKWESYRKKQAETNTFEYKNKKYGMSKEDFVYYNKKRSSTLENFVKRYGEKEGKIKWDQYRKNQAYTKSKQYFIDQHGKIEGLKICNEINILKGVTLDNYINRLGEEEGIKQFFKRIQKTSSGVSKIQKEFSSILFEKIKDIVNVEKVYFVPKTTEFGSCDLINKKYYKYDFVISDLKICIEFNGDYYHANPRFYSKNDIISFFKKSYNVDDIWKYDENKKLCLVNRGFKYLYVWEYDWKNNKLEILNFLVDYIKIQKEKLNESIHP
jgi:hypothetical protein